MRWGQTLEIGEIIQYSPMDVSISDRKCNGVWCLVSGQCSYHCHCQCGTLPSNQTYHYPGHHAFKCVIIISINTLYTFYQFTVIVTQLIQVKFRH